MWLTAEYSNTNGTCEIKGDCLLYDRDHVCIGLMSNFQEENLKSIENCYKNGLNLEKLGDALIGQYSAIIYQKDRHSLYCMQDVLQGLTPLYYAKIGGVHYINILEKIAFRCRY